MILLLELATLTLQAQPVASLQANESEEIVVMGRRLGKLRLDVAARDGRLVKCEIKQSTGYPLLDSLACDAARACAVERPPNGAELVACIQSRKHHIFEAYKAANQLGE